MEKHDATDLFLEMELRHLYSFERQLEADRPEMLKLAVSNKLKTLLERCVLDTHNQNQRIRRVFELLDIDVHASTLQGLHGFKNCLREIWSRLAHAKDGDMSKSIQGILSEGQETLAHFAHTEASDVALIGLAKKIDGFEIASYQSLCHLADRYKLEDVRGMLLASLKEKESSYKALSDLEDEEMEHLAHTAH